MVKSNLNHYEVTGNLGPKIKKDAISLVANTINLDNFKKTGFKSKQKNVFDRQRNRVSR